jgi:hypothetical protein
VPDTRAALAEKLAALVQQYGLGQWQQIAKHLENRLAKQCRDRWVNKVAKYFSFAFARPGTLDCLSRPSRLPSSM